MQKWQRGVLWTVGALIVAAIAGAVALQLLIDSPHLRQIAEDKVQQASGRKLAMKTLDWSVFPYPALRATGVSLSNASWAQDRHFLEIDEVDARLALLPLLTGRAVVKSLDFNGLKVNLETDDDGTRNWDMPTDKPKDSTASVLQQLQLTSLRIKDANVIYRAAKSPAIEWQVASLKANSDGNLRNVSFLLNVEREGHPLQVGGRIDDLSKAGMPDAQSAGSVNVKSGPAVIAFSGTLPLTLAPRHYNVNASIDAGSMKEIFGFFDIRQGLPAALKSSAVLIGTDDGIDIKDFKLQLGILNAAGEGRWRTTGARPSFDVRLQADRVDMIRTFVDAGRPPLPPKQEGELFRDDPLPWPLLASLAGTQGKLNLQIGLLTLRSGIDVTNAAANMTFDDDRMTVHQFSGKLLGGSASGDALLVGRQKSVQLNLQLQGTELGQWFKAASKNIDMRGGAMQVDARVAAHGDSMKALLASASGPVNIRVGPARILSPAAGHAEFWFNGLFSRKDSSQVDLACVSMRLPFHDGIAQGEGIAGARSDASQLLTSGSIDMRQQTVDLHGRIRARSGVSIGISTFAGEVKIVGKVARPQLNLDEAGVGGAIARIGAAIVTSGISIIATSIWDGANPESDPCQVVFSEKAKAAKGHARRDAAR